MTTAIFIFLAASAWAGTVYIAYRIGVGIGLTAAVAATIEALNRSVDEAAARRNYERETRIN